MTPLSLTMNELARQTADAPVADTPRELGVAPCDEALAAEARRGSLPAFGELVERYQHRLVSFLSRRCGSADLANDLAQEAFLRAWERRETYRPGERVSAWLFTIAARVAIDAWRAKRRDLRLEGVARDRQRDRVRADQQRDIGERSPVWIAAERVLPNEVHAALWLRYVAGLEMDELARVLGRTSVGVRVMLMRARRKLAQELHIQPILDNEPHAANTLTPKGERP